MCETAEEASMLGFDAFDEALGYRESPPDGMSIVYLST
jgi:hypothetical protein